MAKVELEGKLTSGFPAMTTTVQVHKRSPRNGLLKWIVKPESTDGRREGWANWDEGAYKEESLVSIGTDVTRQRVFSSLTGPGERSMEAGESRDSEIGRSRMHSRTGRTRVWRRWVGCG